MSGWIPIARSSFTECWVGLVLISRAAPRCGTSVTWMKSVFTDDSSRRSWRIASKKGRLSMSPTVPPISTIATSTAFFPFVTASIRLLISSVTWGMTWTVRPR